MVPPFLSIGSGDGFIIACKKQECYLQTGRFDKILYTLGVLSEDAVEKAALFNTERGRSLDSAILFLFFRFVPAQIFQRISETTMNHGGRGVGYFLR